LKNRARHLRTLGVIVCPACDYRPSRPKAWALAAVWSEAPPYCPRCAVTFGTGPRSNSPLVMKDPGR
jgi:hypothetical protein